MSVRLAIKDSTVLVADDNPNNLQLMESMLRRFGCKVRVALDGEAALKSVAVEAPDLILLDVHMPKLDGYGVCEGLKANEKTREIPVLFVSALNEEFNKVKGLELGAVDYVTKPVQFEELAARVGVHLQLARHQKALIDQTEELRTMNECMIGREMRVLELKREVNDLSKELGRVAPYDVDECLEMV